MSCVFNSARSRIWLIWTAVGYPQWSAALISGMRPILRALLTKGRPLVLRLSLRGRMTNILQSSELETQRRDIETKTIVREKMGR